MVLDYIGRESDVITGIDVMESAISDPTPTLNEGETPSFSAMLSDAMNDAKEIAPLREQRDKGKTKGKISKKDRVAIKYLRLKCKKIRLEIALLQKKCAEEDIDIISSNSDSSDEWLFISTISVAKNVTLTIYLS